MHASVHYRIQRPTQFRALDERLGMTEGTVPIGKNRLLESLDKSTRDALFPDLKPVHLPIKQYVYEPGKRITKVYFPIDGVVSILAPTEVGPSIEVATIGNEGMAGLPLFLGTNRSPGSCFSQVPGAAFEMKADDFLKAVKTNGTFTELLHLYTQALMVQISQGTACNRAHSIEQRCARWLLLTHDRVRKNEFLLTQEFLGQMLGVRRASVGGVTAGFQQRGYIRYSRGMISSTNRKGLESASCICYSIIRKEYDRLLKD
jgi:CRP-like cAMP-binding protein